MGSGETVYTNRNIIVTASVRNPHHNKLKIRIVINKSTFID
jgi:hypothetical protein